MNNNNYSNALRQQRCETEGWNKTKGPNAVHFDEMEAHQNQGKNNIKIIWNI